MKTCLYLLFSIIGCISYAQSDFSGTFHGELNGDPTKVVINQDGKNITGQYIETLNTYTIKGQVTDAKLKGQIIYTDNITVLGTFTANLIPTGIHMDILLLEITNVAIDFYKETNTKSNKASSVGEAASSVAANDGFKRDPAVIGHWIKEEIINSGTGALGAGMTTAYYLQFKADGSFIQEKQSSAGGANWSGGSSRTLDASGHWYTKDGVLFVRPKGYADYVRLNAYLFHNGALVFKTVQGKYDIWNKN